MNVLLNNMINESLVLKKYNQDLRMPYQSMASILDNIQNLDKHNIIDNIWKVNDIVLDNNHISSPITTARILRKKKEGYSVLDSCGFSYLESFSFSIRQQDKAFSVCKKLLKKGDIVLKSSDDLYHFIVSNEHDLEIAWQKLAHIAHRIICESKNNGDMLKVFIKNNLVMAVYGIVPSCIIGDGRSTIKSLINQQNDMRKANILYKDYLLNIDESQYDLFSIPNDGKVIKFNNSSNITNGAMYVDLTLELGSKFFELSKVFNKLLCKVDYLEVTCHSENFFLGTASNSFYISKLQQNAADITHLFSCCNTMERLNDMITNVFYSKQNGCFLCPPAQLEKAELFSDSMLNKAYQSSILKEASDRLGLLYNFIGSEFSLIEDPYTGKKILFTSGMSQETSYLARVVSNDKFLSKKILIQNGINTPQGLLFSIKDRDSAFAKMNSYGMKKWVVKPLDGSGGNGVSTGVDDRKTLDSAWNICEELKTREVLLEEEVIGNDYRVIVIQNKVCAVTQRIAAYVIGDGVSTIDELVKIKANERKKNPFYRLKTFEINSVIRNYLLNLGLSIDSIPLEGEKIQLLDAVNIGSGGESIDRTDQIHNDWIEIAVKIRTVMLNAHHIGFDLMAEDIGKSPFDQQWSVIEVNTNPDLGLQVFPGEGKARDIGKSLLKSLFDSI